MIRKYRIHNNRLLLFFFIFLSPSDDEKCKGDWYNIKTKAIEEETHLTHASKQTKKIIFKQENKY